MKNSQFIKRTQDLGFTLEEIKSLLSASNDKIFRSEEMQNFATSKIKEIETKIHDLHKMKTLINPKTNNLSL
ncbi:MerR family DNA-binding protein [Bacillus solitudinis]|uniref:MerR family DNA-binding protein n=1 Tax=Bacillus solitudinis TaxID=2014074 RepID=UPI0018E1E13B|nr:MerR family DNA-binding protein [Bacillus solitudinis]